MRRTAGTLPCPEAERGHQVTARLAPSRPVRKVACSSPGERRGDPRAQSGRVRGDAAAAARAARAAVRCGRGEGKGRGAGGPSWQHWHRLPALLIPPASLAVLRTADNKVVRSGAQESSVRLLGCMA